MNSLNRLIPLVIAILLSFSTSAFADGKTFIIRDREYRYPVGPNEQVAAISHRDGIEKMIIAIDFEAEQSDSALWIFPVPGTPERIKLDIVDSFPEFMGYDPRGKVAEMFFELGMVARAPLIFPFCLEVSLITAGTQSHSDISVHAEVEKWGIHLEAVTANSTDGLIQYLKEKEADIPAEELETFESYLSDRYVFVVAWIASREELLEQFPESEELQYFGNDRRPCLFVEFPTDKAFYPLKPTGGYGDEIIPVRLYVIDYVKPKTDNLLSRLCDVAYFRQGTFSQETPRRFSEGLPAWKIRYTRIILQTPAKNFTDDLWFEPAWAPGMRVAGWITDLDRSKIGWPGFIVYVAILSYISAGLSAKIVFRKWRGYAWIGFFNLLTILGLAIAARIVLKGEATRVLKNRFWTGRVWDAFLIFFIFIYISLTGIFQVFPSLLLGFTDVFSIGHGLVAPLVMLFAIICAVLLPKSRQRRAATGEDE